MKRLILAALFLVTWRTYEVKEYSDNVIYKTDENGWPLQEDAKVCVCEPQQHYEPFPNSKKAKQRINELSKEEKNRDIRMWGIYGE